MRFLLYLLWSLVSLLVIIVVTATIFLAVYHDEVEEKLVSAIERGTGRNIEVEGGFRFFFTPWPTLIATEVKWANSDWASYPWMLEIETIEASLSLRGLFEGQINIQQAEAQGVKVLVEQNPDTGVINWYMGRGRVPRPIPWPAEKITIHNALVTDAEVKIEIGAVDHFLQLDVVSGQSEPESKNIDIQALGIMDGSALDLNLEIDSWRNMFMRDPTQIRFDGLHGAATITGKGEIRDLLSWQGHDIALGLSVPTLREVQSWVATYLIDTPELHATARFVQPGKWPTARLDAIDVQSDAYDGETRIRGAVGQLRGMNGIDLQGEMHYPLASIMRWKGLDSTTDTQLDVQLRLSGNKTEALGFEVISASLVGEGVDIQGQGKVGHLLQADTSGIELVGEVDSIARIGHINAKHWFDSDPVQGTFQIRKKAGRLALNNIALSSFSERLAITGELDDITAAQLGNYQLNANLLASDIERLNELNGARLPVFNETGITGAIDMQRAEFAAREVELNLRSEGLHMRGAGDISDLKTLKLKDVELSMEAESITRINDQFATAFPELGSIEANGEAFGSIDKTYNINVLGGLIKNKHQIMSATGYLLNLGPELTAELQVQTDVYSATNIPPLFESSLEVPDTLLGKGDAILIAQRANDWSFKDINLVFSGKNHGTINGTVLHFPLNTDFNLVADFSRLSPDSLPTFPLFETLRPENIRAYSRITRKPDQDHFSFQEIDAHFSLASGIATANMGGSVGNINQMEELQLLLGLNTSDLALVPYLDALPFERGLQGTASVKLEGSLAELGIILNKVDLADTDLRGELLLLSPDKGNPVLRGSISSINMDLLKLIHEEKRTRLFSDVPLEFGWINDIDMDLQLEAEYFNGLISRVERARTQLKTDKGVLTMPNFNGRVGNGSTWAWLSIVALEKPYNIVTSLKAERVKSEHINLFGDSELIQGGEVDIDIGLGGSGTSIADYMGNAYGKIQLQMKNSSLKQKNLQLFGSDLITGVMDIVNTTLSLDEEYKSIECGVIHFPVIEGKAVAAQGIALKTDKVTVLGGGVIDFGSEELELIIRPKARKGLGINAGTVANVAKISGTIGKPKIALDSNALLQSSATIGVAIVSGGWSLLAQGLLDKNKANSDVCGQTLKKPNTSFFQKAKTSFQQPVQSER